MECEISSALWLVGEQDMKSASSGLISFLENNSTFLMADCYTFSLSDGSFARYTDADADIVLSGNLFSSVGPVITRTGIRTVIGAEVDTMSITMSAQTQHLLNGIAWFNAIRSGALDYARVKVERLFMPTWGDTSLGTVMLFSGMVGEIQIGRTSAQLTVNSDLNLLNVQMPKNLFQASCLNSLFDSSCTVVKSAHSVSGTVNSGSGVNSILCSLSFASDFYDMGTITFTTGVNAGITRSIRSSTSGDLELRFPLLVPCAIGDAFHVYPGCDKLYTTCDAKFSNVDNFRGFPFVPVQETAI